MSYIFRGSNAFCVAQSWLLVSAVRCVRVLCICCSTASMAQSDAIAACSCHNLQSNSSSSSVTPAAAASCGSFVVKHCAGGGSCSNVVTIFSSKLQLFGGQIRSQAAISTLGAMIYCTGSISELLALAQLGASCASVGGHHGSCCAACWLVLNLATHDMHLWFPLCNYLRCRPRLQMCDVSCSSCAIAACVHLQAWQTCSTWCAAWDLSRVTASIK
jgi:hypothetical protein